MPVSESALNDKFFVAVNYFLAELSEIEIPEGKK